MIGSPARALAAGALAAALLLVGPASPALADHAGAHPTVLRASVAADAPARLLVEPATVAAGGGEGGLDSDADMWVATLVMMLPMVLVWAAVYVLPVILVVGAGVGIWFLARRRRRRAAGEASMRPPVPPVVPVHAPPPPPGAVPGPYPPAASHLPATSFLPAVPPPPPPPHA